MVRLGMVDPLASLTLVLQGPHIWPIDFQEYGCKQRETCQCIGLRDLKFTGYSMSFLLTVKNVTGFTGHIFPYEKSGKG